MVLDHVPQPILVRLMSLDDAVRGLAEQAAMAEQRLARASDVFNGRTHVAPDKRITRADFDIIHRDWQLSKDRADAEQAVLGNVKRWIEGLPANTRLEQVRTSPNGRGLAQTRERMAELRDALKELRQAPTPSADFEQRLAKYVSDLAASARPIFFHGISGGDIVVGYPGERRANRHNRNGFDTELANGLLMMAFVAPELLLQRLIAEARHVCSIPCQPEDRPEKIRAIEVELDSLGYAEESIISRMLDGGETPVRHRDARPQHVLQVRIRTQEVREAAPVVMQRPRVERPQELRTASAE